MTTFDKWFCRVAYFGAAASVLLGGLWTFVLRPPFGPLWPWWTFVGLIPFVLYLFYTFYKISVDES